ncbi:MAG: SDR family oxidoreductase [Pseudomonadota bacterium]|nr:SDR family oxidoreductase [Pseudomonadota bacterium]
MFDLGLRDKVAVITGGSDGLGLATAERLATEGAKVVICARREDHLLRAAEGVISRTGAEVLAVRADVSVAADIERLIDSALGKYGGVDILVNNAGKSAAAGLEEVTDVEWEEDLNLKVMGAVRACRRVIPIMRERGGGAIVNATIVGGKAPAAKALPTSVSRAAGINLTKSLANQYAEVGIRVNTVCIGLLKSEQWVRRAGNKDPHDLYTELSAQVPLGRVGESEEYADLVAFLVSDRASYITGVAVNIDGGMSAAV